MKDGLSGVPLPHLRSVLNRMGTSLAMVITTALTYMPRNIYKASRLQDNAQDVRIYNKNIRV
jgi:hypothetical protein